MTQEQQKRVEDSLWVVGAVLKRLGKQGDEDLRQALSLYMCKCVSNFDESKNTKWTTYAYNCLYLYALRFCKKRTKDENKYVSLQQFHYISDDGAYEYATIEHCQITSLCAGLNKTQTKCAVLFSQGYTIKEIADALNRPPRKIKEIKQEIGAKLLALKKMTPP